MALARALFAELNLQVQAQGLPALGAAFRDRLSDRLRVDWGFRVFALAGKIKAFFTGWVRERRREWTDRVSPELGDILLYQANGDDILRVHPREGEISGPTGVPAQLTALAVSHASIC